MNTTASMSLVVLETQEFSLAARFFARRSLRQGAPLPLPVPMSGGMEGLLPRLLEDCVQSHWDNSFPNCDVCERHKRITDCQEKTGSRQLFTGRFSKEWGRVHDAELSGTSAAKTKHNSGKFWIPGTIKIIWDWVCEMWPQRNKDRHGHDEAERVEKTRQMNLREIAMWHGCRDAGKLEMSDAETRMFHETCAEHSARESSSRLVTM